MYETRGHFDVLNFPHVDLGSTRLMRVAIDASGPFTPSRLASGGDAARIPIRFRITHCPRNSPTGVNASSRLRPPQTERPKKEAGRHRASLSAAADRIQIERCCLIDLIDPVREEQMRVASPAIFWLV